jgi:hypothetical protein
VRFAARLRASNGAGDVIDAARWVSAARPDAEFFVAVTPMPATPDAIAAEAIRQ